MNIIFHEATRLGARQSNQDYFAHVIDEDWCCFIIADGLGGHAGGEIASKEFCLAIIELVSIFSNNILHDPVNGIEQLIASAWQLMRKRILEKYHSYSPQTTFALVWMNENQLVTAHIGDSRIYRLDSTGIIWRSSDHTLVQQLFEEGKIHEDDFGTHPMQNRLLQTVNIDEEPEPDITLQPFLIKDQAVLLCTDGFWSPLKQADVQLLAVTPDISKTSNELIEKVLRENPLTSDNISLQIFKIT